MTVPPVEGTRVAYGAHQRDNGGSVETRGGTMSSAMDDVVGGIIGQLGGGGALGGVVGKLAPALVGMLAGGGLGKLVSQFSDAGLSDKADPGSAPVTTSRSRPIT